MDGHRRRRLFYGRKCCDERELLVVDKLPLEIRVCLVYHVARPAAAKS